MLNFNALTRIYLKILKLFCVRVNDEFEMNSMSLSFFYSMCSEIEVKFHILTLLST